MTAADKAFVSRLQRRAAAMTPETARRYLEAYRLIRGLLTERELVAAINSGSVELLVGQLASDEVLDPAVAKLRLRLDQVIIDTARKEANALPSMFQRPVFDILNPRIITAARTFDGLAIQTLLEEVRGTILQEVLAGLEEGKNPRTIARRVRGSVGLAPKQAEWVENFRRELADGDPKALHRVLLKGEIRQPDGTRIIRSGHASGEGLTKAQVRRIEAMIRSGKVIPAAQREAMVEAYRKRLMALNVEAHTKTQMLQAQKQGQRLSWEDAIERGVVPRSALRRRWLTTIDGRERPEHNAMNGTIVGFDEEFEVPGVGSQLIPGEDEYNCRCLARTYIDRKAMRLAA